MKKKFLDKIQSEAVKSKAERIMVLGEPGTGKTEVIAQAVSAKSVSMAERLIVVANKSAVMDMRSRVEAMNEESTEGLFIGSVNNIALRVLFDNDIILKEVKFLTEEEITAIIAEIQGGKEPNARELADILSNACKIFEEENAFEEGLRIHKFANGLYGKVAQRYLDYKRARNLIDENDVSLLAYRVLRNSERESLKWASYEWIGVDDVQNLSPLDIAIVDKLCAEGGCILYTASYSEAICSVWGARWDSLDKLIKVCGDSVFELTCNYRSSKPIHELLSDYARCELEIKGAYLHNKNNDSGDGEVPIPTLIRCEDYNEQCRMSVALVRQLTFKSEEEKTAVVVRSTKDVKTLTKVFREHGIEDFICLTVHQIKGRNVDNVIVFNASVGVYPYYIKRPPYEDARVLYVAMSRARKRVFVTYSGELSLFIRRYPRLIAQFYDMPEGQRQKMLMIEEAFVG